MKKNLFKVIASILLLVTLVGCNAPKKCTVTFDGNGGNINLVTKVTKGDLIDEPKEPTKEGFTFIGWQLDNKPFDFKTKINKDITLVANYKKDEKTEIISVTLKIDDISKVLEIKKGSKLSKLISPNKENYSFLGWYLDGKKFNFNSNITSDITLVAKWEKNVDNNKKNKNDKNYSEVDDKKDTSNNQFTIPSKPNDETKPDSNNKTDIQNENSNSNHETSVDKPEDFRKTHKEYLGTWYLYNNPNSTINILSPDGSYLEITTNNFNLDTFKNDTSGGYLGGHIDSSNKLKEIGISVNNGLLQISNRNGTREFYRQPVTKKVEGISFNKSSIELYVFRTDSITATITPTDAYDKSLIWTSSNPEVAIVGSDTQLTGYITAQKEGIATITATTKDGNLAAHCEVVVKKYIAIESFTLNHTALTLDVGDKVQLEAIITPSNAIDQRVRWESTDPSIVTVDQNGLITVVGKPPKNYAVRIFAYPYDSGIYEICNINFKS